MSVPAFVSLGDEGAFSGVLLLGRPLQKKTAFFVTKADFLTGVEFPFSLRNHDIFHVIIKQFSKTDNGVTFND